MIFSRTTRRSISASLFVAALAGGLSASGRAEASQPYTLFESGQVRPLSLSPNGKLLFAVKTPDNRLEVFRVKKSGLVHKGALVKVLGRGQISRAVTVKAHAFSKTAEAAITGAGGTVERLPLPWGDRRPPAKGNQHTNR